MNFFLERFGYFWKQKIDFESQNFAIFDNFYSTGHKTLKLDNVMVVGFEPKGRHGRMCDSVR